MADSKLVTYENYTTHCNSRNGKKIQKIFVHHMAGIMTVKDCGRVFKTREASAHYGIDATGAVGQYVHESKRAWSVASRYYDEMAISIELANSTTAPTWKVSEVAIEKCIDLIVDICKRNGIEKINYTGDLSGNLCMHCWVVSTACPGAYLKTQFKRIANSVNEKLKGKTVTYGKMIKYTANRVVNVYADHSISSKKLGKLKKGSVYTATQWYRDDWCYIPYVKGWVPIKGSKGTYLDKTNILYTVVNSSGVNVYADHTTKSKCLKNIKRGSTITATQWYGAWAYIPSQEGWVAVSCLHQGDRAQALLYECAEIAKVLKKYNFSYSTSNLKYTLAAAVKSDHRIDCAHYVSFAMQALNILPSGKYIWLNKGINGNGASYIKKSNLVTITYPNKLPSKCNLKPGDICGWGYTINGVEGQHTMVYAGKDAQGNMLWYTAGTSDVNNESYGAKQKPTYVKRPLNVLIRLK